MPPPASPRQAGDPGGSTVSVVMCTFNGAAFLPYQLESLAIQTRLPDELVVRDDGSTDDTLAILADFVRSAPFPVVVNENRRRLGIPDNFWAAISDATGELIALCDQDDIWAPAKLERAVAALDADPAVGAVFTNGWCIDGDGEPTGVHLWDAAGFSTADREDVRSGRALDVLLRHPVVTGATLTFRASLLPGMDPWPPITHDIWISIAIAMQAQLQPIDELLIAYRLHGGNAVGFPHFRHSGSGLRRYGRIVRFYARRLTDPEITSNEMVAEAAMYRYVSELLERMPSPRAGPAFRATLERLSEMLRFRQDLPRRRWRRVPQVFERVRRGDYRLYSNGWRSWVSDLIR
ncbi:MAG: glycosyltransferase [Actinomycetota bacterium]|nr:glycosyltransferase [Actinomycetota bacterium]